MACRRERARLRRALHTGEITLADWFTLADRDPDGVAARTRPIDLVRAWPGHRRTERAQAVLDALGIAKARRVRGLGKRQRAALIREMDTRMGRRDA
ncbi:hypothetical protein FB470_000507 [Amycolatopsis thermophila]|uniref:Integration host factor-like helix-two turn-helix domain-containing protein n=1 Tax=Amycolatopsis thermophila TaxID=206084 RepID=A0ABU0EMM0_9PSEU|nr:hypothetical protein [Amycolatopsis thermophila]